MISLEEYTQYIHDNARSFVYHSLSKSEVSHVTINKVYFSPDELLINIVIDYGNDVSRSVYKSITMADFISWFNPTASTRVH